ncbi:MAG: acyl carrier protein [Alphaproteobacteria bacterium]|nr:acyl carrier protein [Alphaproteobacteria bacterium]
MKDNDAIADRIRDFIREELNPSATPDIDNSMNLLDAGIIDSTAVVELVLWLEETFQLEIDPEALTPDNFATLDAMVAFIGSQRDAQAA